MEPVSGRAKPVAANDPIEAPRAKPGRGKGYRLTPRDLEILRYVVENRFAPCGAVERLFWAGRGNWNHYRRLRKLAQGELLEVLTGDRGIHLGYRITRKGLAALRAQGVCPNAAGSLRARFRSNYDHDTILQDLQRMFSGSPLVSEFVPEHQVREILARKHGFEDAGGRHYKVPDGLFRLQTAKRTLRVALELEIARKGKARLRHIFKQLSRSRDFDVIFFVVADEAVLTLLKALLDEVRRKDLDVRFSKVRHGFYFARLADVLDRGLDATFEGDGKSFSLRGLEAARDAAVVPTAA